MKENALHITKIAWVTSSVVTKASFKKYFHGTVCPAIAFSALGWCQSWYYSHGQRLPFWNNSCVSVRWFNEWRACFQIPEFYFWDPYGGREESKCLRFPQLFLSLKTFLCFSFLSIPKIQWSIFPLKCLTIPKAYCHSLVNISLILLPLAQLMWALLNILHTWLWASLSVPPWLLLSLPWSQ